jgi:hypothetical protein
MPPIAKGLILAGIAVVLQLLMELLLIRPLIDMSWGAAAGLGIAGAVVFGLYGFFVGWKEAYDFAPRTIWAFILDVSWSSINTTVGLIWMIWCATRGTFDNTTAEAKKRGVVLFLGKDAALPGADATTLGTVMGGSWMLHEAVHVQQARIFGPLYWPVYLLSYFTALLVRAVTIRFHRLHWQAYGRVVMEDWAYNSAPGDKADQTSVEVGPTILWLGMALINAFGVAVLFAPIPGVGALPAAIGLTIIPWWIGLIVIFVYAIVRAFFVASDPDSKAEAAAAAAASPSAFA